MGKPCEIRFYDVRDSSQMRDNRPHHTITIEGSKVTSAIWGPYDETLITGHENGTVKLWDTKVRYRSDADAGEGIWGAG
jgi:translation initiation factor 3 subunit I